MQRLTVWACLLITLPAGAGETGFIRVTGDGAARVFRPDGTRVEAAEKEGAAARGQLSPDGKQRAYVSPDGDETLYVTDADGSNATHMTPENMAAGHFSWVPDGKSIALLARPRAAPGTIQARPWEVYTVGTGGRNWKLWNKIAKSAAGAELPKFSPGGGLAWLQCYPREGKLQPADLVVLTGDERRAIVKNTCICDYAWSPDGATIACAMSGKLGFVDVASGKQQSIELPSIDARLSSHAAFHLTFSPDGESVACKIIFLGGRREGGPAMFGDDEVFIVPRQGEASWFQPGINVTQLQ